MGQDKATLLFCGRPMIGIAIDTLQSVCANVFISGNRDDLAEWAPVVRELRTDAGPAAGIEAALLHATADWVLLMPVDLPLMSATLLRKWIALVLVQADVRASYLECGEEWHPALCLVHRSCLQLFQAALNADDRKLTRIFKQLGTELLVLKANEIMPRAEICFRNVNTTDELAEAERVAYSGRGVCKDG
jgi:molybdopterin-guanine dinucleotide biosynthesis protein A